MCEVSPHRTFRFTWKFKPLLLSDMITKASFPSILLILKSLCESPAIGFEDLFLLVDLTEGEEAREESVQCVKL